MVFPHYKIFFGSSPVIIFFCKLNPQDELSVSTNDSNIFCRMYNSTDCSFTRGNCSIMEGLLWLRLIAGSPPSLLQTPILADIIRFPCNFLTSMVLVIIEPIIVIDPYIGIQVIYLDGKLTYN